MNQVNVYNLQQLTTRELLKWLNLARKFGGGFDPTYCGGLFYTIEELKFVLGTREHVPNKREAELLRRDPVINYKPRTIRRSYRKR